MKILFTGGGTGGHIFPIIAINREIRRIYPQKDLEIFYIGPKDEFGLLLLSQEGIETKTILSGKIRRYFSLQSFLQNIGDILFKIPFGVIQSFYYLIKIKPHLVFSKGGSGSLPVTLSARILRIPVFLHESDVVPGLSNRVTTKWAEKIFISFPRTEYFDLKRAILVGNPLRKEVLGGEKEKAKELFNLTLEKPIIMFLGGSQGAEKINDFVLLVLNRILLNFEIIHQCGVANFKEIAAEAQVVINKDLKQYYHPFPFLDEGELKHAYQAADFIVSRAGAGSIFEIAALGKPSILVPLPSAASDHQAKNAYIYSENGACLVMEQDNLTPNFFLEKINYLFSRSQELEKMKEAALNFSKPLAAKTIAREILEFLMLE